MEPCWHSYRPESAGNGVLRLSDLKILGGTMPPDTPRGSRLRRSQIFPVPLEVVPTSVSPQVGHSVLCITRTCIAYHSNIKTFGPIYWGTHPSRGSQIHYKAVVVFHNKKKQQDKFYPDDNVLHVSPLWTTGSWKFAVDCLTITKTTIQSRYNFSRYNFLIPEQGNQFFINCIVRMSLEKKHIFRLCKKAVLPPLQRAHGQQEIGQKFPPFSNDAVSYAFACNTSARKNKRRLILHGSLQFSIWNSSPAIIFDHNVETQVWQPSCGQMKWV